MHETITQQLEAFFGRYKETTVEKGFTIVHGHQDPPGVMWLLEGSVAQYDIGKEGQKLVVNIFRPGAFFPMSWAINGQPNTYFFEALETVRYRTAPPDEVVTFLHKHPDILLDLLGRVYRGTDGLQRRMTYLMAGDAHSRLVVELLIVSQRFGKKQRDGSYEVAIRESDLANYTGLTRETVSRTLQTFKKDGKLEQRRGKIIIRSLGDLEQTLTN